MTLSLLVPSSIHTHTLTSDQQPQDGTLLPKAYLAWEVLHVYLMYCGIATHGNTVMLNANMTGPTCPSTWCESQLCPKKGSSLHFAIVTATPCCHTSGLTSSSSWQSPSGHVNLSLRHHSCPLHTLLSSKLTASPQSLSFLGPSLPQLGPHGIITRFTHPTMTDHANPPACAIGASERLLTGSTETPHFGRVWTTQLTSALHHTHLRCSL